MPAPEGSLRFPILAFLALFAVLLSAGEARAQMDPQASCGLEEGTVPAFTLEDVNPNSSTYGQQRGLDDSLGRVLVIYFATAT